MYFENIILKSSNLNFQSRSPNIIRTSLGINNMIDVEDGSI